MKNTLMEIKHSLEETKAEYRRQKNKWGGTQTSRNHWYVRKIEKKWRKSKRTLEIMFNTPTSILVPEEERDKGTEKIFEVIIAEKVSNMGKGITHSNPGSTGTI